MASTTRYAKSGDVHIAYRTLGSGPVDVVVAEQWFSNVEIEREVRPLARFNDRLSAFARVIRFDKRGVGLSDPVPATALPTRWPVGSSHAYSRRRTRIACAPSSS